MHEVTVWFHTIYMAVVKTAKKLNEFTKKSVQNVDYRKLVLAGMILYLAAVAPVIEKL